VSIKKKITKKTLYIIFVPGLSKNNLSAYNIYSECDTLEQVKDIIEHDLTEEEVKKHHVCVAEVEIKKIYRPLRNKQVDKYNFIEEK
jgi:hypothetical protein